MSGHVYEVLADVVWREGVRDCFALLGDANMHFATVLEARGCRMIHVRHEHNATSASMAYARACARKGGGGVGVSTVTCGPGLTQLMTALPAAARARIPLVVIAGEAPLGKLWYNQEIDQAPFVRAAGAHYVPIHEAGTLPTRVRDAFLLARTERVPVVVSVPFDLGESAWTGGAERPVPSRDLLPDLASLPPAEADLARAAAAIDAAERIVVMGGLGAREAGPALRALAERCGALTATTLPARGLFHDDPWSLHVAGGFSHVAARRCFQEADLVIAAGASLASHNADAGKLWARAQLLQIDTAPVAVAQGRVAANLHLRADARLAAEALAERVRPRTGWRTGETRTLIADTAVDDARFPPQPGAHDPRDAVAALDRAVPKDWHCVNSSGHCSFFAAHMYGRPAERFHTIREFGAIGNGLAYAMGVAAAHPDERVVLFDGDGSVMMHVQELDTMRRENMNVAVVVLNDRAYGSEIHKLRADGLSDGGAVFGATDFAAIARGFGVAGHAVDDLGSLDALVSEWHGGPVVWDVPINDRVASPVIQRAHPQIMAVAAE